MTLGRLWDKWGWGWLFILLIGGLLEACVQGGVVKAAIVPPPSRVLETAWGLVRGGGLWAPVWHTASLLLLGWALACIGGAALGLAMGFNRRVYALFEVLVELIRPVPKPALVPPLMLLLGMGPGMEIAIVFLGAFFPVLISAIQAAQSLDPVRLDAARTLRVGKWRTVRKVIVPQSLPMVLSGMKISLALAIVLAVLAEMLTGTGGLGAMIVDLQRSFRAREMYAWVLVLAVFGCLLVYGFEWLERRLTFWQTEAQ